jgi:hypothetical protein
MGAAMPAHQHAIAPPEQLASYSEWLKVSVALRYALTCPWAPDVWRELRQQIRWLVRERDRIRYSGMFN